MSLPIARARRKKVPSIHRSPYSSTRSHSRTESSNPSVVMSQAPCSSAISHSSLTSRSSESTRAKSESWPSSPETWASTRESTPRRTRVFADRDRRADRSLMCRVCTPSEEEISPSVGRRPAQSSPYSRSRKNSSVSRELFGRAYRTASPSSITSTASLVWLPQR